MLVDPAETGFPQNILKIRTTHLALMFYNIDFPKL